MDVETEKGRETECEQLYTNYYTLYNLIIFICGNNAQRLRVSVFWALWLCNLDVYVRSIPPINFLNIC